MQKCETGGLLEDLKKYEWKSGDSCYDTMLTWLDKNGFGTNNYVIFGRETHK